MKGDPLNEERRHKVLGNYHRSKKQKAREGDSKARNKGRESTSAVRPDWGRRRGERKKSPHFLRAEARETRWVEVGKKILQVSVSRPIRRATNRAWRPADRGVRNVVRTETTNPRPRRERWVKGKLIPVARKKIGLLENGKTPASPGVGEEGENLKK